MIQIIDATVKPYQRKQLLERVNREAATVGASIPETIELDGTEIQLQSFVFEIRRRETIPPGEQDRVETAKRNLRRERLQRLEQLENEAMSYTDGEALAESIIGIDRALEALQQLEPVDVEAERNRQEAADRKRWLSFLKQALGRDTDTGKRFS